MGWQRGPRSHATIGAQTLTLSVCVFLIPIVVGGGWCWDKDSCLSRGMDMRSSSGWGPTADQDGIFNSSFPVLANANLIYMPYCSSDGYAGDIGAEYSPFGFHFRGQQIVTGIFMDLIAAQGMGSGGGDVQVLYTGCSAGARGALFNLDRIGVLLNQHLPGQVSNYGGLLDSAFWIDMQPYNSTNGAVPFATQVQLVYNMTNATSTISASCAAAYPASSGEQWKCMMGQYAVKYVASPYLLHAFQYDQYQITTNYNIPFGGPPPIDTPQEVSKGRHVPARRFISLFCSQRPIPYVAPLCPAPLTHRSPIIFIVLLQIAYDELFRNLTRQHADDDTVTPSKPHTAALLPACYKHCNTQPSTFRTASTNNVTLEQATVSWFFGPSVYSAPAYVVEDCAGFNCGNDCPALPTAA